MQIYAPAGSTAETYATEHELKFDIIENLPPKREQHDGINFEIYCDHVEVDRIYGGSTWNGSDYRDEDGTVHLPDTFQKLPVTAIQANAIDWTDKVKAISIPASVKRIGKAAFSCSDLESITFEEGFSPDVLEGNVFGGSAWLNAFKESGESVQLGDYLIYGGNCIGDVTVPDGVRKIAAYAYANQSQMTSLTIPKQITEIPEELCKNCEALETVYLHDGVTSIGEYAFANSGLTSLTIPEQTTEIPKGLCYDCEALETVHLHDSVTSIGTYAFDSSGLKSLTVPGGVTIGDKAFYECNSLTSITFQTGGHTSIGQNAFLNCGRLKKIVFENDDCEIDPGKGTFCNYYWNYSQSYELSAVIYGNEGSPAQEYAETNDYSFKPLEELPPEQGIYEDYISYKKYKDHIEINNISFAYAPSNDIVIPAKIEGLPVTYISKLYDGSNPWEGIPYKWTIELPDSITELQDDCFSQCSGLTSAKLPASIKALPENCFAWCENLKSVELPAGITEIPTWCFVNCTALEQIVIPASVTKIGTQAFAGCRSLKTIKLPDALESISAGAFNATDMLTEIHIPANVKEIGGGALATNYLADASNYKLYEDKTVNPDQYDSKNRLSAITVDAQNPFFTAKDGVLYNKDMTEIIAVPDGKTGVFTVPDTVKKIAADSFSGCTTITEIVLPEGLEEIKEYGISRTGIETLTLPDSLKTIGISAFADNIKLKTIQFPEGITEIPDGAFSNARALEAIRIPNTITVIGSSAFAGCTSLKNVTIPESVTTIRPAAFGMESSYPGDPGSLVPWLKGRTVIVNGILLNINVPNNGILTIPDGVRDLGGLTFNYNSKLTSVEFPESLKLISGFIELPNLKSVIIRSDDCKIEDYSFSEMIMGFDEETDKPIYSYNSECTVYCNDNSTAAAYATEKGFKIAALPEKTETTLGDVNNSGSIDAIDASLVLAEYAAIQTGKKGNFTDEQRKAADVNGDGAADAVDASKILAYYSYIQTGHKVTFEEFLTNSK